jgi:uncharacterized protein YhaN
LQLRVTAVEKLWDDSSKLETSIGNSQLRITKLRGDSAEVTRQLEEWQLRWAAAIPDIGLSPVATLEQAEVALAAWQKVPDILRERDNRERRVAGMQRDSNSFEGRARAVLEIAAVDLISIPIEAAAKKLGEHLSEATNAKARRDQVAKRLDKAAQTLGAADRKLEEATAELNTLHTCLWPRYAPHRLPIT